MNGNRNAELYWVIFREVKHEPQMHAGDGGYDCHPQCPPARIAAEFGMHLGKNDSPRVFVAEKKLWSYRVPGGSSPNRK